MLNKFYKRPEIQKLAADHGLDGKKTNNWLTLPSNYPVLVEAFLKSVCHCVYLQHVSFTKPSSVLGSMFWRCLPSLLIFTSFSMTYAVEQVREETLLQDQIRLRPFYQFTDLVSMFVWCFCSPGHIDDIYPYFMRHAKRIFPMLDCMDDLRKISDLRVPANWYVCRTILLHLHLVI